MFRGRGRGRGGSTDGAFPSFAAPLTTTLVAAGNGGGTPTFTRATTETYFDFENVLKTAPSGAVAITGARMNRNLVAASESIAAYTLNSGATRQSNTQFTITGANSNIQMPSIASLNTRGLYRVFVELALTTGGPSNVAVRLVDVSDGSDAVQSNFSVTTTPTIFSFVANYSASSTFSGNLTMLIGNLISNVTATINITKIQINEITGASDQTTTPEYVSKGVLSSPWHGAGIDGLKYFNTTLAGAAIPATTLLGVQIQGARTNSALYARDLTQAATWVPTTMTTALTQIGIDGAANSCTLLTATGANSTVLQTIVLAAAARSTQFWIKRSVGTGNIDICRDGVTWVTQTINASTFTKCVIENSSVLNPIIGIRLVTSGDAVIVDYAGDEAGGFCSTPILTTTVAVTRNVDELSYVFAGNAFAAQGTAYLELSTHWDSTNNDASQKTILGFGSGAADVMYINSHISTSLLSYDGTNFVTKTGLLDTKTGVRKRAVSWVGTRLVVTGDGLSPQVGVFDGAMPTSSIKIGNGNIGLGGNIRNVRIYAAALPDATLQALTA